MSQQKNANIQGMGMRQILTVTPQLLQCSMLTCYQCYEMYPDGFICAKFKRTERNASELTDEERRKYNLL